MFTLHATARLLARLKAAPEQNPPSSTGRLGDWYANLDMKAKLTGKERNSGLGGPSIVIIVGKDKPFRTELSDEEYRHVRALGEEYGRRAPRSVERS